MRKNYDNKLTERQRLNLQFADDRLELLDTIRDMIDIELDRRGISPNGNLHTKNQPPNRLCLTLWQRIMSLFNTCQ